MKLIPRCSTHPFLQLFQWTLNPVEYLHQCDRECGDTFTVSQPSYVNNITFTSNPQIIQQILTNDTKKLSAPGAKNQVLKPFLGDRGVILLDGAEHRQRRQLLMPQFHGDRVQAYTDEIQGIVRDLIKGWQVGDSLNIRAEMQKIALSVILRTIFGLNEGKKYDLIEATLSKMLKLVESPVTSGFLLIPWLQKDLGTWSPWGRFVRDRAALDVLIYAEIAERRQSPDRDRTDILSVLISSKDADGNGMSDLELRDELLTLLFAGHETSATAIAWAIYWISYLPEVKEKLLQEIATLGTERDPSAIIKLPYLNAVYSETLRIYPVGMLTFARTVEEPISIQGYELEPGQTLVGCIYLTHHREDLYPEPHLFKPERFLENQFSPYEYLPFGGGVRRCVGAALAQLEIKLALVEIITSCHLKLTCELPVIPTRRGITLGPKGDITVRVESNTKNQDTKGVTI